MLFVWHLSFSAKEIGFYRAVEKLCNKSEGIGQRWVAMIDPESAATSAPRFPIFVRNLIL